MKYVYGASETVTYEDGVRIVVHVDEPWLASDPIVKKRPDLFSDEPLTPRGTTPPVEQATAAPAETRTTTRKTAARKNG